VGHTFAFVILDIAVIIVVARLFGRLARKLNQPAVIGEVVAGIALGPSLLGRVWPEAASVLFPAEISPLLSVPAQIGIILFMFLFPLKLKFAVAIYGAIAFLGTFNPNSGVSDVAHLSGMAFAYLFLKLPQVRRFDPLSSASQGYKAWKLARAKKKFQVYLRKQRSDRGPFVN